MAQRGSTPSTPTRRSALAHNLAGVFVIACWLDLDATRVQLTAYRSTGHVDFTTPWPRRGEYIYALARMVSCLAGPAAESQHTRRTADSSKAEAQALSYAKRAGVAQDKRQALLERAHQGAQGLMRDRNLRATIEVIAAELLRSGTVSAQEVANVARHASEITPRPMFGGAQ
jgi:hypothetical protein